MALFFRFAARFRIVLRLFQVLWIFCFQFCMAAFRADPRGKPASVFQMNIPMRDCSCKHAFCFDVFVRTNAYREGAMGYSVFAQLGAAFWTDMFVH